jgi:Zn-dependent M28 family amino/carboxypeptidase
VEALRLIKELGLRPKRTIRAVMFMNEEFGGSGGRDYASSKAREKEIHLAAVESDRGGFLPLGFGVGGGPQTVKSLQRWEYLFQPFGMFWIKEGGGGVDIAPLFRKGTITISLIPESHKYFDFHHSARDVLDAVHPRELELGAIAMAIFAYVMAQEGI